MSKWYLTGISERVTIETLTVTLVTDVPCHLWCRQTIDPPHVHLLATTLRGVTTKNDPYYCFDAYHDLEQIEPGDTLEHTFILTQFLENTTRYYYFHGQIAGVNSLSTSCIFGRKMLADKHTITNQVQHQADEGGRHGGSWFAYPDKPPGPLWVGRYQRPAMKEGCVFRIFLPTLNNGAEILLANIVMTNQWDSFYTGVKSRFRFEAVDAADDWYNATEGQMLARYANTIGNVDWDDMPAWYQDLTYISPDLTPLVQNIVNRPGWKAGNGVGIFWTDFDQRTPWHGSFWRRVYSYNLEPTKAPKIIVDFRTWYVKGVPLW